jgi:polar amino acid transport system substrate-binding protein
LLGATGPPPSRLVVWSMKEIFVRRRLTALISGLLMILGLVVGIPGDARAADPEPSTPAHRTFRVGTTQSEPWVMYDDSLPDAKRVPEGFSIDLWAEMARRLNGSTQWVYYDTLPQLLDGVKNGQVDAGIAAVTISVERERYLDFSNSMYESGLRILIRSQRSDTWSTVRGVLATAFWNVNTVLVLGVLTLVAHLLWFFNRRRKGDFVPQSYRDGILEALRWAFMGLVGVGAGVPKKGWPWVVGMTWSFLGKMLFIVLTGVFSAALALSAIEGSINTVADLKGKQTAVIAGNAPEVFMKGLNITNLVPVKNMKEGVDMLVAGQVDAFVHDAPRLQYWRSKVNQKAGKEVLRVTLEDFERHNYGIIFPVDSRLRKETNLQLLNLREAKAGEKSFYDQLLARWIPR